MTSLHLITLVFGESGMVAQYRDDAGAVRSFRATVTTDGDHAVVAVQMGTPAAVVAHLQSILDELADPIQYMPPTSTDSLIGGFRMATTFRANFRTRTWDAETTLHTVDEDGERVAFSVSGGGFFATDGFPVCSTATDWNPLPRGLDLPDPSDALQEAVTAELIKAEAIFPVAQASTPAA